MPTPEPTPAPTPGPTPSRAQVADDLRVDYPRPRKHARRVSLRPTTPPHKTRQLVDFAKNSLPGLKVRQYCLGDAIDGAPTSSGTSDHFHAASPTTPADAGTDASHEPTRTVGLRPGPSLVPSLVPTLPAGGRLKPSTRDPTPPFAVHAGRAVPMPSHPSARRCSRRQHVCDGREDGMSTHAGAFRCHRIRPRDAVPDGACMCAGATDVKAVGHKTLHLTRRTKTSLDCTG